jgi:hypothetical protein
MTARQLGVRLLNFDAELLTEVVRALGAAR